jgi:hypothetical protein
MPNFMKFLYLNFLMEAEVTNWDYILAIRNIIGDSHSAFKKSEPIWQKYKTNRRQKKPRQIK